MPDEDLSMLFCEPNPDGPPRVIGYRCSCGCHASAVGFFENGKVQHFKCKFCGKETLVSWVDMRTVNVAEFERDFKATIENARKQD